MTRADLLANLRSLNATLPRNPDEPPGDPPLLADHGYHLGRGIVRVSALAQSPVGPWLREAVRDGAFDGIDPKRHDLLPALMRSLTRAACDGYSCVMWCLVDWLRTNGNLPPRGVVTGPMLADAITAAARASRSKP